MCPKVSRVLLTVPASGTKNLPNPPHGAEADSPLPIVAQYGCAAQSCKARHCEQDLSIHSCMWPGCIAGSKNYSSRTRAAELVQRRRNNRQAPAFSPGMRTGISLVERRIFLRRRQRVLLPTIKVHPPEALLPGPRPPALAQPQSFRYLRRILSFYCKITPLGRASRTA
jgi:hypothetical protein